MRRFDAASSHVAGHDDHAHVGADALHLGQHLLAARIGHAEVEQHHVDLVTAFPEGFDRQPAATRRDDVMAGPLEERLRDFDDTDMVVDDENPAAQSLGRTHRNRGLGGSRAGWRFGQQHPKRAADPDLAAHLHGSAVRTYDSEHPGEAEASARELGREERLEDARLRRCVHAAPVVGDLEEHVGARRGLSPPVGSPQIRRARAARGPCGRTPHPHRREGFAGVGGEVQHDLSKLGGVALDRRARSQIELESAVLRNGCTQEIQHFLDELGEIERLQRAAGFTGVGEHLLGEARASCAAARMRASVGVDRESGGTSAIAIRLCRGSRPTDC